MSPSPGRAGHCQGGSRLAGGCDHWRAGELGSAWCRPGRGWPRSGSLPGRGARTVRTQRAGPRVAALEKLSEPCLWSEEPLLTLTGCYLAIHVFISPANNNLNTKLYFTLTSTHSMTLDRNMFCDDLSLIFSFRSDRRVTEYNSKKLHWSIFIFCLCCPCSFSPKSLLSDCIL